MLYLFGWLIYGLIVGYLARLLHPGDEPKGFLWTLGIGIAGSYVGGLVNWVLGMGGPFEASGILMGIVGGVVFCFVYTRYLAGKFSGGISGVVNDIVNNVSDVFSGEKNADKDVEEDAEESTEEDAGK